MTAPAFEPAWVGEVELAGPVGDVVAPVASYRRAQLLVRIHGTPVGLLSVPLEAGACDAATLVRHVREDLGPAVAAHLEYDGLPEDALGVGGLPRSRAPLRGSGPPSGARGGAGERHRLHARPARPAPDDASTTILASRRGDLEVIVVDNAPQTAAARDIVAALGDPRVRYVLEPRPGLSRARNRGAQEARGRFLVFTDDDVRVDPAWLGRLLNGFTRAPHVGCATGVVLAAELETPAQAYIEQRLGLVGVPPAADLRPRRAPQRRRDVPVQRRAVRHGSERRGGSRDVGRARGPRPAARHRARPRWAARTSTCSSASCSTDGRSPWSPARSSGTGTTAPSSSCAGSSAATGRASRPTRPSTCSTGARRCRSRGARRARCGA